MFQEILRRINNIRLRQKLIFSFIIVVFVPVMAVGLLLTNELSDRALDDATKQTQNNVERVKQRMEETLKVPAEISFRLMFDSRLKEVLNTRYEEIYDVVKSYRNYPDLKDNLNYYKEISDIRIYTSNESLINNWEFMFPTEEQTESAWYKQAMEKKGQIVWTYIENEKKKKQKYLSLARRIDFTEYKSHAVIVIDISADYLNSILSQEPFTTFILDDNHNIVSSNRTEWIGMKIDNLDWDTDVFSRGSGTYTVDLNGQNSKVFIEQLLPKESPNSLRVATIFSIDSILADSRRTSKLGLGVIAGSLAIAIVMIYGLSYLLSRRMLTLSRHMNRVAIGNFNRDIRIDGKDEVGQLARQFQVMTESIQDLMTEVQQTTEQRNQLTLKQNEIKFKMLASQINPHFLFNTLESIRMKAIVNGQIELAKVVRQLGVLMRNSLEVGGRDITLESEFDMIRNYLEIQKFRFEDRLQYELSIEDAAKEVMIPPLIIQPLVENAVLHGLESKLEGGYVKVSAAYSTDGLLVQVHDNGSGMTRERLEQLRSLLREGEADERTRIGMLNVHQRLQLSYGEDCGLQLESVRGEYTHIQFLIPVKARVLQ